MLPDGDREAMHKDMLMCERFDVWVQARGFRKVEWRLQEKQCLEGTRGRRSFLICTKQADKRFAATHCDIHILLAAFWAFVGTSLAIQRREWRYKQICIARYFLDRIACLFKTTRCSTKTLR